MPDRPQISLATMHLLHWCLSVWRRDPDVRMEDAYKWLFHAALGGEHAIVNADGPRHWLDREWPTLGPPRHNEPLTEPLRPDGLLVRLHLRPYRAQGGDRERLLRAFVASAVGFHRDKREFAVVWNALGHLLRRHGQGSLTWADWQRLDRVTRPGGYPAIDHSAHYEKVARPAYRVLTRAQARELIATLHHP